MARTLKIVKTDFGADCDDQKAVSGLIESLGEDEELAFIVSGPHPLLAASAIAEKYKEKTGVYPLVALGQKFEAEIRPDTEIYSLVDGQPMLHKNINAPILSPQAFQEAIDIQVKSGSLKDLELIILAPLHNTLEYYNPDREVLGADDAYQGLWAMARKTATLQFQRTEQGECKGNNYQKSSPGIADGFLAQLETHGFETVFFDGAVAKFPEFLMLVAQDTQLGLQRAAESYMARMQAPWLYMTEAIGVTPSLDKMHAGMFTVGASFPFGVHVAAGTPAGFGVERALKEICGITRDDPQKFAAAFAPIEAELERFDGAVLQSLQKKHPEIQTVRQMREEMHRAMIAALQAFAEGKGVVSAGETVDSFVHLFKIAKDKGIKLNPYNYIGEFKKELYAQSPIVEGITAVAEAELGRSSGGPSHTQILCSALAKHGARAIIYDAVAVSAAATVRRNDALKEYFAEKTASGASIINITAAKVEKLRGNQELFSAFANSIREALTIDGAVLAQGNEQAPDAAVAVRKMKL